MVNFHFVDLIPTVYPEGELKLLDQRNWLVDLKFKGNFCIAIVGYLLSGGRHFHLFPEIIVE
jgi:hypothetical protein